MRNDWYAMARPRLEKLLDTKEGYDLVRLGETFTWRITADDIEKYNLVMINRHFAMTAALATFKTSWRLWNGKYD